MSTVVDLKKAKTKLAAKKSFRNWTAQLDEEFGAGTRLADITFKNLVFLARGKEEGNFFLFDLIMNLKNLGSGFEFNKLSANEKMVVMEISLFLMDRVRFEYMKRLDWIESYPGEESSLVDLIMQFDELAPRLHAETPALSRNHPAYDGFSTLNTFEKEEAIRKLLAKALKEISDQSTTL